MKSLDQIEPRKLLIARSAGVSIGPTGTITISEAGSYTSLAFGPDGQPPISYRDPANGDVKFARKGIFRSSP